MAPIHLNNVTANGIHESDAESVVPKYVVIGVDNREHSTEICS